VYSLDNVASVVLENKAVDVAYQAILLSCLPGLGDREDKVKALKFEDYGFDSHPRSFINFLPNGFKLAMMTMAALTCTTAGLLISLLLLLLLSLLLLL